MNIKEKIKELLGAEKFAAIENLIKGAFSEVIAKDGSVLKYEGDLKEGTAVFVSTPDGDVAVPDGIVELEDGTMLEVVAGVVVTITPGAEQAAKDPNAEAANAEAMTVEQMGTALSDLFAKVEALTNTVAELQGKFSEAPKEDINAKIEEAINNLKASELAKISADFKVMVELINEIGDLPTGEPKEKEQNFLSATDKKTKRILELSKSINKIKK
jgi:hypothetical protein